MSWNLFSERSYFCPSATRIQILWLLEENIYSSLVSYTYCFIRSDCGKETEKMGTKQTFPSSKVSDLDYPVVRQQQIKQRDGGERHTWTFGEI